MKRFIFGIIIFTFGFVALSNFSASAQNVDKLVYPKLRNLRIPKIDKITLKNGLRLYIIEDKSLPVFDVVVRINCGSYLVPSDKIGLAEICGEVMRTGGTAKWSGDELDEMLEGIGGSVETSIGLLSGNASVNVLSEYTDLGLETLADILRKPIFDEDKVELAKIEKRSMISRRNDLPSQIGSREFKKIIYGANSVYARQMEYATVNNISRQDLIDFHDKYIHPENIQMGIWGDFNKKDILKKINKYFGDWKRGSNTVPPPPKVDYKYTSQIHYIYKPDVNQSNIYIGHIGGLISDDDCPARVVMNNILGASFGSRLFNSVRSREGLAYSVFGVYTANIQYPGIFYNYASTKSETTGKTIQEIIKEIKRMQTDPPTSDEMKLGKEKYLNSFVFKFDSKKKVINRVMRYDFFNFPDDYIFREKENIEKVSSEDVIYAARKDLHPDKVHILVVGNGKDFDMPLEDLGYGPVDTIDVSIPPPSQDTTELNLSSENIKKGMGILRKAISACGGLENFKSINSVHLQGTYTISTPQGDMPMALKSIIIFPDKQRTTVSMMGRKFYDIRNGEIGWKTGHNGNIVKKSAEDIKEDTNKIYRSNIFIFRQFDNPYYKAVYSGEGEEGDMAVQYLTLIDLDGNTICKLGISSENFLPTVKTYWGKTSIGEGSIKDIFDNYSDVGKVKIPFSVTRMLEGRKVMQMEIDNFIINGDIPKGAFDKPE